MVLLQIPLTLAETSSVNPFLPQSFSAEMEQIITSSITGNQVSSYGKIDYKFRGHLKIDITKPESTRSLFVSNPQTTWYYTPPFAKGEAGTLTQNPTNKSGHFKFFDLLSHGLISNDKYSVTREVNNVKIVFSNEYLKKLELKEVVLYFNSDKQGNEKFEDISKIQLLKSNNSNVIIKLSSITKNVKFDENYFVFTKPINE